MEYDALGQLKKKRLGTKNGTSDPLAHLDYEYNIRGWLLSVNKDYITASANNDQYFGMELSYNKNPGLGSFTPLYNGNVAGTVWKSEGDGEKRKYDFSYDAVNRLTGAAFTQYVSGSGASALFNISAGLDFSVSNLSYDYNGNILSQDQKGWKLGGSTFIDQLRYTYGSNGMSNKLQNVMDLSNNPITHVGDFRYTSLHPQAGAKDAYAAAPSSVNAGTVTDYSYDDNGNLVKDLNKGIEGAAGADGIKYNHLNLPQKIHVKNATGEKGYVDYTYDAAGNKLRKIVHEDGKADKTTLYLYGTYEDDVLQFLPLEEGRVRMTLVPDPNWEGGINNPCLPVIIGFDNEGDPIFSECPPQTAGMMEGFVYDYLLKDHLGNVRTVLTEEEKVSRYPAATLESTGSANEEALYSNLTESRYPIASIAGYPADDNGFYGFNYKVARVKGGSGGQKIGPAIMLKVMSGDHFNVQVSSWYKLNGATPQSSANPFTELVTAMAGGISSVTGVHGTSTTIANSGALTLPAAGIFALQNGSTVSSRPKAFLNWVLLDEQFNFVQASSGADQVPDEAVYNNGSPSGNNVYMHQFTNLPITKNGYLYVYVSNETPNIDVFFDNLQVTHLHGPLLEETHYYPFGLQMVGISSKAAGGVENKKKWNKGSELQSEEFSDGSGLAMYATPLRSLDPQLGRWWQIDPKPDYSQSLYSAMGNNPILFNDPLGDTLRVTGNQVSQNQFAQLSNTALGGFYTTTIAKDGKVSFTATDKKGTMSLDQLGYFGSVLKVMNQKETTSIGLVQNDKEIVGGSYLAGKIDVADVAAFGNNKAMSAGSVLAHEITEQSAKQKDGLGYNAAHTLAIYAETGVTGFTRNEKHQQTNLTLDNTGTVELPFSKQLGVYQGKPLFQSIKVTIYMVEGNITKTEEK